MPERRILFAAFTFGLFLGGIVSPASAASLRGSMASVQKQYRVAMELGLPATHNTQELEQQVAQGTLVQVSGNENLEMGPVSFPYTRPTTKAFIECFAREYRTATGEPLVVTSLTRPLSRQPRNASDYSVHPMGIAVDFRRSNNPRTRMWMERRLQNLEAAGVIEATHEHRPPHYHVAVFPTEVVSYAAAYLASPPAATSETAVASNPTTAQTTVQTTSQAAAQLEPALGAAATYKRSVSLSTSAGTYKTYRVARGDTLWTIASRFETSVGRIRKLNGLRTSRIYPGQKLMVPGTVS
jgi:LysM repeat protein